MDLKQPGDWLYIIEETRAELGGSLLSRRYGAGGGSVPAPVPDAVATMRAVHRGICTGLVRACHDLSEGGLAVAAAEMAIAGRLGLELDSTDLPRDPDVESDVSALFSETNARFLVEVHPEDAAAFEQMLAARPFARVGSVTRDGMLHLRGFGGGGVVDCTVQRLVQSFCGVEKRQGSR